MHQVWIEFEQLFFYASNGQRHMQLGVEGCAHAQAANNLSAGVGGNGPLGGEHDALMPAFSKILQ